MDHSFNRKYPLLPPILIGIISAIGICGILAFAMFPGQTVPSVPTPTITPFKYLLLYTETPLPRESVTQSEATATLKLMEQGATSLASPAANGTEVPNTLISVQPTATAYTSRCAPASAEIIAAIRQEVQSSDPESEIIEGWVVESQAVDDLLFLAAKVHNAGTDSTLPGVWGIFGTSEGLFDLYAVNEIAQEQSFTMWGTDVDPAITMQTDGAQTSYDCASSGQVLATVNASYCAPASSELIESITQEVQSSDPENEITGGWVIESQQVQGLVFLAARIHSPSIDSGITLPSVWGIFDYSEGDYDLYAINEIAQEFSFASSGTDMDPAITMQSDGAQLSYSCALDNP